jgi:RNA polymerase sigma-70 factor, ECF subfamily
MKIAPKQRVVELRRDVPEIALPNDAPLMAAIAAGDLGALGVLYDRYHADVLHFAERAAPGGRDADDLVHEVFLTLPRAAQSFDARPCARPFLIGVAAQLLRRRRRSFARLTAALQRFRLEWSATPTTPEEALHGSEDRLRFKRAIDGLSEEKRLVFLLVESEGMCGEDVARALDIPVATVWTRLHYARRELRARLTKAGLP